MAYARANGFVVGKAKSTINEHIQNIYQEGELDKEGTLQKFGNSEFQQKTENVKFLAPIT